MPVLNLSPDELLSTTRSVRKRLDFSRPVEPEVIRQCLETALQAPTGGNRQGWHFVVVTDVEKRQALGDIYRRGFAIYRTLGLSQLFCVAVSGNQAVPDFSTIEEEPMRFSIFSVADHYPEEPRTIRELYAQILDEIELADELGFSAFFLAEHHFHEYGLVPSPPTLLGAAAERTKRIGLGVAVAVLPFHQPLVVAEEYAMLDQMTGGRLVLGVGSGYLKHEFEGFYLAPWEKRARFDEALKIVVQAWEGKPFSYHGLYHHVENTRIAVTPVQKPHPPLWVAILRQEAAYHVGKQSQNIMLIPYATCETKDDLKGVIDEYYRGYTEATGGQGPDIAVALHTYVSESPGSARAETEEALNRYVRSRLYAKRRSYDELETAGLMLFGDAEQVSSRIRELEAAGMNHLMILPDFGALQVERVRDSLHRFAREVMPNFAASEFISAS